MRLTLHIGFGFFSVLISDFLSEFPLHRHWRHDYLRPTLEGPANKNGDWSDFLDDGNGDGAIWFWFNAIFLLSEATQFKSFCLAW